MVDGGIRNTVKRRSVTFARINIWSIKDGDTKAQHSCYVLYICMLKLNGLFCNSID